jgi:hypothetical protein
VTTAETASLVITATLGVLAIGLSIFTMVLSWKFNDRSFQALDAVKSLVTEIRSLMDSTVKQQKDFSSRMLDSILEKGPYGHEHDLPAEEKGKTAVEQVIKSQLEVAEKRIVDSVEEKMRSIIPTDKTDSEAVKTALDSIREDISSLANRAATTASSSTILPEDLKQKLMKWQEFPAHYLLLAAIIKENARTEKELLPHVKKYAIPQPMNEGFHNLLESGILEGSQTAFEVKPELKTQLAGWLDRNWSILTKIMEITTTGGKERRPQMRLAAREISF